MDTPQLAAAVRKWATAIGPLGGELAQIFTELDAHFQTHGTPGAQPPTPQAEQPPAELPPAGQDPEPTDQPADQPPPLVITPEPEPPADQTEPPTAEPLQDQTNQTAGSADVPS